MTAKKYLSEVIHMKKKAQSLARKEEGIRAQAEGLKAIMYDRDKVQTSASDKMPDYVAEMVAVQDEYARTIIECNRYVKQCEDMVSAIRSTKQADVLRWRYLEDNDGRMYYFSEIAEIMGVENVSSIIRLHKRALKSFENKWHGTLM